MRRPASTVLAILLGSVFVLGGLVEWWRWQHRPAPVERSPLRKVIDSRQFKTFAQPCSKREDCEESLACVYDARGRFYRCLSTECLTDDQCEHGDVCRTVVSMGPLVSLCTITGTRKEGEQCHPTGRMREIACGPGLYCNQGFCGRACRPDELGSCPSGFRCAEGLDGHSCVPSCRETGCPAGLECIHSFPDASYCARIVEGWNCYETPCPEGQKCQGSWLTAERTVKLSCITPCGPDRVCPEGQTCVGATCKRLCSRSEPGSCHPGEACLWHPVEKVWGCESESD